MSRFSRAKDKVIEHLDDIVPELFGAGKKQTKKLGRGGFQVANRWRPQSDLSQMKVWPGGAWKDFAGNEQGDAMDLVAYGLTGVKNHETRMRALEWVEDRFGIRDMDPETRKQLDEQGRRRREKMATEAAEVSAEARRRTQKAFYAAQETIIGTLPEIYLRGRSIDVGAIPNRCPSFRYRPDCEYWPGRPDGGKAPQFPGMMSAMVDANARLGAVHYTFLEPDGRSKLKTLERGWFDEKSDGRRVGLSAKLMFPDTHGLVIRVTRGPSNLTCEEAAAAGKADWLLVTEGIEDAMSFALADPSNRVHAAGSLSAFLGVPDLACVKGYLIARDNDWDKPQAVEQFEKALVHFRSFGKPVEPIEMPREWGKDANDVLNWKG
jgi:hypothetical protein